MNHIPIGMEMFNAGDDDQWAVIQRTIDTSDYYVVIIGLRYGSTGDDGVSYTEREYDYAVGKKIPVMAFVKDQTLPSTPAERESDPDKQAKLTAFISKAEKRMRVIWKNPDELASLLSPALVEQFSLNPRNGWIPANFDPLSIGQEIATLSKENRELREQLSLIETRKPQLDFSLESEERLCFKFTRPQQLFRQELMPEDISDELIRSLEAEETNIAKLGESLNFDWTRQDKFSADKGDSESVIIDVGETDYRKKMLEAIAAHNAKLPSQQEFDDYNAQNARYINMSENKFKAHISVENNGTLLANQVTITLRFPPEILVFDDYDIEKVDKPKKLDVPSNPLHHGLGVRLPKSLATAVSMAQAFINPSPLGNLNARLLSGRTNNYYTIDEDYLCYKREKLLHTHAGRSNDFYIVATQKGTFEIEGEIICEELSEPICKTFTVTVE